MYQYKKEEKQKNDPAITITIPTYNRVEKLRGQVERLLPQLSGNDIILILDNATPSISLDELNSLFNDDRVVIHKNTINVGANANVIRCFEHVETQWMWLLSDDDIILPEALEVIRKSILEYDVDFINFSSELLHVEREDIICNSLSEYISSVDSNISNHLLMSNNVYRVNKFKPYLSFAFWGVYVNAPHLVPVYCALQSGATILLSSKRVVTWENPTSEDSWRFANLYNLLYLPDVISNPELRDVAIKNIMRSLPAPEKLIAQLSQYKILSDNDSRINSYAKRILNIYIENGGTILRLRAALLKWAINFPRLYIFVLDALFKCIKKKSIHDYLQKGKFEFYI